MTSRDSITSIDSIFAAVAARDVAPGIVYGVVRDGALVHTGGIGTTRVGAVVPPDADSVYRIASMTKSFTAASVVLLRDEGRLGLDDPVARWVPDLADLQPFTADSLPITIRHLLTMSAGFPTDDPWGDRQQGLDFERFAAFLREGPRLAWAPGTRFDYSNLGYGILGRVITNVAGQEYRDFVRERLLGPLGMTATAYAREAVPDEHLAHGYVLRDGAWLDEPIDAYGALSSMGGVFTSIRDLSIWVAGFLDAVPPRDDPEGGHPLSRASRREMQQVHRSIAPELSWASPDAAPNLGEIGYGFGLFVIEDPTLGRFVGHSGGYPGFGSRMLWHPSSGHGVMAFGNGRYARVGLAVRDALVELVQADTERPRRVRPWPETLDARVAVERLLDRWDDEAATGLFAMNIELDEPLAIRRSTIAGLRATLGPLRPDETTGPVSSSAAHIAWWMTGERGRLRIEILMSPERPPRVQTLKLTVVPAPPSALTAIAGRSVAILRSSLPTWPPDIALAPAVDRAALDRALRATEARFGPLDLGPPIAGDGQRTATWRLTGDRGQLDLTIELDGPDGAVTAVTLVPRAPERSVEAV